MGRSHPLLGYAVLLTQSALAFHLSITRWSKKAQHNRFWVVAAIFTLKWAIRQRLGYL